MGDVYSLGLSWRSLASNPGAPAPGFEAMRSLVPGPSAASFLAAYVTFEPPSDKPYSCQLLTGVQRSRMRP